MASQRYEVLLRALKQGEVAPVYYLFGPEEILKEEAARAILDLALDPAWRDFNFDQRDASQLDPESLDALVNTLPMMAGRRVVIIRGIEAWKKKAACRTVLLKYLANPSAETVLVLVQGSGEKDEDADPEIARHAFAVNIDSLSPERVARWAVHHAERAGFKFEAGAAEHLAAAVQYDLGALRSELEKLASLSGDAPITRERIGELVGIRHGETIFDWRDAVFDGQTARAVRLLGPVLDQSGVSGVKLVTTLGTTLTGIGLARTQFDRKARGGVLTNAMFEAIKRSRLFGLPDWRREAAAWCRWAESWPLPRVREGLRGLLEADRALKSTRISDERGVLTDVVLFLNVQKREAA